MHDASTLEEVYLDIIALAKGKALEIIGDKHGVALSTLYVWRKRLKALATTIPALMGLNNQGKEGASTTSESDEEEYAGHRQTRATKTADQPPIETPKGRQRDGYYSLPVVAKILGKSESDVRQLIRDDKIQPEIILVKRHNRNVPGYSDEVIHRLKDRELKTVGSGELRQILELKPHTYRRFLEYVALVLKTQLYARKFFRIKYCLETHKAGNTYRFDRDMIPDFQHLKEEFRIQNDGRKRQNKDRKKALKTLPHK